MKDSLNTSLGLLPSGLNCCRHSQEIVSQNCKEGLELEVLEKYQRRHLLGKGGHAGSE